MSWLGALLIVATVYLATNIVVRRFGVLAPSVSAGSLRELIARRDNPICLVDLRAAEAYASGHIPTAVSIPFDSLERTPTPVEKHTLLVLCGVAGSRAAASKRRLARLGFKEVVNFGPVSRWDGALLVGGTTARPSPLDRRPR